MTLRTLNYGNYGIFLIMGNAGFCPSTVSVIIEAPTLNRLKKPVKESEAFPDVPEKQTESLAKTVGGVWVLGFRFRRLT